jgi:hypothetical protein
MTILVPHNENLLTNFDAQYDNSREGAIMRAGSTFRKEFSPDALSQLTLERYAIGDSRTKSFCQLVLAGSPEWPLYLGFPSCQFGVEYGSTIKDPAQKYRFDNTFGANVEEAFAAVRTALLSLVILGKIQTAFKAIDANPLPQRFKALILSLYYPGRFLAVCSSEHLEMLGFRMGYGRGLSSSQYQNLLLKAKQDNPITSKWSALKFIAFLYWGYVRFYDPRDTLSLQTIEQEEKQRQEAKREVDTYASKTQKNRMAEGKRPEREGVPDMRNIGQGCHLPLIGFSDEDVQKRMSAASERFDYMRAEEERNGSNYEHRKVIDFVWAVADEARHELKIRPCLHELGQLRKQAESIQRTGEEVPEELSRSLNAKEEEERNLRILLNHSIRELCSMPPEEMKVCMDAIEFTARFLLYGRAEEGTSEKERSARTKKEYLRISAEMRRKSAAEYGEDVPVGEVLEWAKCCDKMRFKPIKGILAGGVYRRVVAYDSANPFHEIQTFEQMVTVFYAEHEKRLKSKTRKMAGAQNESSYRKLTRWLADNARDR